MSAFEDVKTGTELILNGPSGSKRVVSVGRTPKQLVAGSRRFDLTGAQIGGDRGHWLSRPKPGQIESLKQEEQRLRDEERQAERERRIAESTPEELAADFLTGLGAYTSDELLKRCDRKVLIRAANILRRAIK
jgi:hypothetical protein